MSRFRRRVRSATNPYINGSDNLTNSGAANAAFTESGGASGTTYSGTISDGGTNMTRLVHTSGFLIINSANT